MEFTTDINNIKFVEFKNRQNFLIRCIYNDIDETECELDFYIKYGENFEWQLFYNKFRTNKNYIDYVLNNFRFMICRIPNEQSCCVQITPLNSSSVILINNLQTMTYDDISNILEFEKFYYKNIGNGICLFSLIENRTELYNACKKAYPQLKIEFCE